MLLDCMRLRSMTKLPPQFNWFIQSIQVLPCSNICIMNNRKMVWLTWTLSSIFYSCTHAFNAPTFNHITFVLCSTLSGQIKAKRTWLAVVSLNPLTKCQSISKSCLVNISISITITIISLERVHFTSSSSSSVQPQEIVIKTRVSRQAQTNKQTNWKTEELTNRVTKDRKEGERESLFCPLTR